MVTPANLAQCITNCAYLFAYTRPDAPHKANIQHRTLFDLTGV